MEMVFKKKRELPIDDKVTVPVPRDMKKKLEELKSVLNVNEMTRDFFDKLLKETSDGKHLN